MSSKGRASPDTAQARDFALSFGQTIRNRTVGSEAIYNQLVRYQSLCCSYAGERNQ
jgi:hypothetical protein